MSRLSQQLALWFSVINISVLLMVSGERAVGQPGMGFRHTLSTDSAKAGPKMLAFSFTVKIRPLNLDVLSLYVDSPLRQAIMDGGVWVMGAQPDPNHNPITVPRWKGSDFEHMVRQPDGSADFPQRTASSFINSGLWYDKSTGMLYALMHGEYEHDWPNAAWCRKKTWLATSRDMGLHWSYVGDVLTAVLPDLGDRCKYSGTEFEMGPADYDLYVDTRGGYFYCTFWNGFVAKSGVLNHFTAGKVQVARCAIGDKMAPGKWFKFCNGTWTEPGLGGKASEVAMTSYGLYGNTIYSTYLNRYVRIGVNIGTGDPRFPNVGMRDTSIYISTCTDLARQDWTPMAKLTDEPKNTLFGFTLTDESGIDPSNCGRSLHAYNYWEKNGRILDITFDKEGTTNEAPFPEHGCYSYEPHPESGDRIESRKTKIVGCASPDLRFAGSGWSVESDPIYFQGQIKKCSTAGNSVEFSFHGGDIYWRAIAAPDGGKADVYIDGQWQKTVDLYFWDSPLIFQFAFIQTGLAPDKTHTIRIVSRADNNPKSRGTVVTHMAFEYPAECYWAPAGFSSVSGKNNWRYGRNQGTSEQDLLFDPMDNRWTSTVGCSVGDNYQIPGGKEDAVRRWVAPHDGNVRVEGTAIRDGKDTVAYEVRVLKDADEIWSAQLIFPDKKSSSHDLSVAVHAGDAISFIVHKLAPGTSSASTGGSGRVFWDPMITYVEASETAE